MTTSRLFVGGVPPSVQPSELEARFVPFGRVAACEVVGPKHGSVIAYVDLEPKDDAAIAKCMSLYNHSRWKGHMLRVEPAQAHYLARLREEKEDEVVSSRLKEAEAAAECEAAAQVAPSGKAIYIPMPGRKRKYAKTGLDGCLPDGKKRFKKTTFPPVQPLPLTKIPWSAPVTVESALHKQNEIAHLPSKPYVPGAMASGSTQQRNSGVEVAHKYAAPASKVPQVVPREQHGYLKILKAVDTQSQRAVLQQQRQLDQPTIPLGGKPALTAKVQQPATAGQKPLRPAGALVLKQRAAQARGEEAVVDFLDEDLPETEGVVDLDKFGSSSDDDEDGHQCHEGQGTKLAQQQQQQAEDSEAEGEEHVPGIADWDSDEVPTVSSEELDAEPSTAHQRTDSPAWQGGSSGADSHLGGEQEQDVEDIEDGSSEQYEEGEGDNDHDGHLNVEMEESKEAHVGAVVGDQSEEEHLEDQEDEVAGEEGEEELQREEAEEEEGHLGEGEDEERQQEEGEEEGQLGEGEEEEGQQEEGEEGQEEVGDEEEKQEEGQVEEKQAEEGEEEEGQQEDGQEDEKQKKAEQHSRCATTQAAPRQPGNAGTPAAKALPQPAVPRRPVGRQEPDLSRFVSDSEEEYRDVDESEDEQLNGRQGRVTGGGGKGVTQEAGSRQQPQGRGRQVQEGGNAAPVRRLPAVTSSSGREAAVLPVAEVSTGAAHAGRYKGSSKATAGPRYRSEQELERPNVVKVADSTQPSRSLQRQQDQQQAQMQPSQGIQQQQPVKHHKQRHSLQREAALPAAAATPASAISSRAVKRVRSSAAATTPKAFTFSFAGDAAAALQRQEQQAGVASALRPGSAPAKFGQTTTAAGAAHAAGGQAASSPLRFGMSFMRPPDKSQQQLREAWEQQRPLLTADFKSKQRTAVRHAGAGVKKARPGSARR